MKSTTAVILITGMLLVATAAHADVWRWTDANGNVHFVDSTKPIYTWTDESGEVHYSDSPDHEDAVSVEFVWHSPGTLDELKAKSSDSSGSAVPGESDVERLEREQAERYYCKRATEIYDSYVNAPRLFRTNDAGEREYLDSKQAAAMIAETRARKDELCAGL